MKKILIFGQNGQVATDLAQILNNNNASFDVIGSKDIDLSKTQKFAEFINKLPNYDIVINATAYNLVDKAEEELDIALKINRDAVKIMADFCKKNNSLFIHYSTNYVFDGKNPNPNCEDSKYANPLGSYGRSKLEGEKAVINSGCDYLIFRLATVFRENRNNFVTKMLELFEKHKELKIVDDQITGPSYSYDIAKATFDIIEKLKNTDNHRFINQTYHLCNEGNVSYFDFCKFIYNEVKNNSKFKVITEEIFSIPSSNYPTPAQRPLNGIMDTQKIKKNFNITMPSWQDATKRAISKQS